MADAIEVLKLATKQVPAVKYATALAGIAAAASLIVGFVGDTKSAVIIMALVLVGAALLFLFALATQSTSPFIQLAGIIFVWAILLSFIAFLIMTVSAFAVGRPCSLVSIFGIVGDKSCDLQPTICTELSTIEEFWKCLGRDQ